MSVPPEPCQQHAKRRLKLPEKNPKKARAEIEAKMTPAELELDRLVELSGPEHTGSVRLRALHRLAVICELI